MTIATIYGDCASRHAYKLYLLRAMLDLDIEWVFSDISESSTRAERQAKGNPMGQVPLVILANGQVLPESNAALWYFADGSPLLPDDGFARAQVLRWFMFDQNQIDPRLAASLALHKGVYEIENKDVILAYLRPMVDRLLAVIEEHLGHAGRQWFVGEMPSVADIAVFAYVHEAEVTGDFTLGGATKAWIARLETQPGFVSLADALAAERA